MGLVLGFVFLVEFGFSIVTMAVVIRNQRKLRKLERGSSWPEFLTITLVLTILIDWLGVGVWPEAGGGAPTGHDYNMVAMSTFLISLSPGAGFIFGYIFSRMKRVV